VHIEEYCVRIHVTVDIVDVRPEKFDRKPVAEIDFTLHSAALDLWQLPRWCRRGDALLDMKPDAGVVRIERRDIGLQSDDRTIDLRRSSQGLVYFGCIPRPCALARAADDRVVQQAAGLEPCPHLRIPSRGRSLKWYWPPILVEIAIPGCSDPAALADTPPSPETLRDTDESPTGMVEDPPWPANETLFVDVGV